MVLLQATSFCNPLINAEPITSYIPFFSEFAPFGRPPLVYACSDFWRNPTNHEFEIIEILLKNGANPNVGKPIECCLRHGKNYRYKIARLLIDYGADYSDIMQWVFRNRKNDNEEVKNERFDLFIFILNNNKYNSKYHSKYLIYAILDQCDKEAYYLLENSNVNVNEEFYTTDDSYTPLFCAAQKRNTKMFKKLIDYGANIYYVSSKGNTVENIINSIKYDYGYDKNEKWTRFNYDDEKQEMLDILKSARRGDR